MAFGRSRGKLYAQEDIGITFNDVAGIDEAVDELREVVDFLRTPEKYQVLGGRIPKGVLLVGPPGTGKTLLAKAIAGEAGVPLLQPLRLRFCGDVRRRRRRAGPRHVSAGPGQGAVHRFHRRVGRLGQDPRHEHRGRPRRARADLNALLVEMDGFSSNSGVIVMAATNRPETLDPALLRPGRFDRHVSVDRPDVKGASKYSRSTSAR